MGLFVGIILVVIVLILIFLLKSDEKPTKASARHKPTVAAPAPPRPASAVDDLKAIEGVGPKIASLLAGKGYATYAALSKADPKALDEILRDASLAMADPATWPHQARLLAEGKMDELAALQENLKGGRKV